MFANIDPKSDRERLIAAIKRTACSYPWRIFVIAFGIQPFCCLLCNAQEVEVTRLAHVSSSDFLIAQGRQLTFYKDIEKSPVTIDVPFCVSKLSSVNGSNLVVILGELDQAALFDRDLGLLRLLPSFGVNNRFRCGSLRDGVVYFGYQPAEIIAKVIVSSEIQRPPLETMIVSCKLHDLERFLKNESELRYSVERLPQLDAFAMRKVLFVGEKRCYEVATRSVALESSKRILKFKLLVVEVSNGNVRTIFEGLEEPQ